jgi:hypothetical protein
MSKMNMPDTARESAGIENTMAPMPARKATSIPTIKIQT